MEKIKFYIGEENGVVKEGSDFNESIFSEQYKKPSK